MTSLVDADFQTLLVFYEMGIPLYSTRGATQTLKPINAAGNLQRDINGELMDMSYSPFKLFESTISCTDQMSPAFDNFWPGNTLLVDCVCELAQQGSTGGGTSGYSRTAVEGSERADGEFIFYRPRINFRIVDFQLETPEWDGEVSWTMNLEEIGGTTTV